MKMIMIVSTCIENGNVLHFKGVYRGNRIKKIYLLDSRPLEIGRDYLIYAQFLELKDENLYIKTKDVKLIDNINFSF
jgi:hypothetical protein